VRRVGGALAAERAEGGEDVLPSHRGDSAGDGFTEPVGPVLLERLELVEPFVTLSKTIRFAQGGPPRPRCHPSRPELCAARGPQPACPPDRESAYWLPLGEGRSRPRDAERPSDARGGLDTHSRLTRYAHGQPAPGADLRGAVRPDRRGPSRRGQGAP